MNHLIAAGVQIQDKTMSYITFWRIRRVIVNVTEYRICYFSLKARQINHTRSMVFESKSKDDSKPTSINVWLLFLEVN